MSWRTAHIETRVCAMEFDEVPSKQRPRYDIRRKHAYTPRKTESAEIEIGRAWAEECGLGMCGFEGEVRVAIAISRPLAKSNPKYWEGRADLMKPDADNVAKIICDSLNGIAYKDDCQITDLRVTYLPRAPHGGKCKVVVTVGYYEEERE